VLTLFVAVTLAALAFDLATSGESRPANALYGGPFVRVGGTLVAYRRWGVSGSPIVLLGGAAEPTWVWHDLGPLLAAADHRVFALDLPPFGYTQRRGPYTMAPRGVSGVVLLDGDALSFGGPGFLAHLLVYPYYTALYRILSSSDWLVSRLLRNAWGAHPPPFQHALLAEFERPFRVDGTAAALKELAAGGIPGVTIADLRRLTVPRAVVWGAEDNVDSVASGRATARALHVPLQLIPHAGHLSMLARPAAVAAAIERAAS